MQLLNNKYLITQLSILFSIVLISCENEVQEPTITVTVGINNTEISLDVDENPEPGQTLGIVEGFTNIGNVQYEITEESAPGAIFIDANSGEFSVADSALFDFETNPIITATVEVSNMDVMRDASITININDIDERVPISFTEILTDDTFLFGSILGVAEHEVVSFSGRLWIVAGNGPMSSTTGGPSNNLWSSSNGVSWELVDINGTTFLPRVNHQALVFNDRLWVIGGLGNRAPVINHNDVWSSADGITWREENSSSEFSPRSRHAAVVFNDRLWVIGGSSETGFDQNDPSFFLNDVWSSPDGINWTREIENAPFSPRVDHQVVVFNDRMWLVGGGINTDDDDNEIWTSMDGRNWEQIEVIGDQFSPRRDHEVIVFDNKLWLIQGQSGRNRINVSALSDIWTSTDGINWKEELVLNSIESFTGRSAFGTVVYDNRLWMVGGMNRYPISLRDIWTLDN